ncbi:hypothetical protein [Candidatus Xianfuyuplasma coldseepsis]|uniref:N-acetyltransferase domain-containing protein n=1 Tax=Candidatus Xianfuyuplasma coldseepsis TaxID=2782163 RepID=A0A7L7KRK8_9MOLU|nr:hypothetical protein [Xianfuyuplasma coldseepsis]QMS84902.1 hypothetical protein G4Z02_03750 [Xianfuyuplasma coldseepsis]
MNEVALEWLGYIASAIVLVSLLMSSIVKLRWINLVGALLFGAYGFMILSYPTGFMNLGIAIIDIVYLIKMYGSKEYFTILPITEDHQYLDSFIDFYRDEIEQYFDLENIHIRDAKVKLYILRNMTTAGVFVADEVDDSTLEIRLDYAIPQYRDFKLGKFIFQENKAYFTEFGITSLIAYSYNPLHDKYLRKMGFVETEENGVTKYIFNI